MGKYKSKFVKDIESGHVPKDTVISRWLRKQLRANDAWYKTLSALHKSIHTDEKQKEFIAHYMRIEERHKQEIEWALVELEISKTFNLEKFEQVQQRQGLEIEEINKQRKQLFPQRHT